MNPRSLRFRVTAWYASLMAGSLLVFGAAAYLGFQQYLHHTLQNSLLDEARSLGVKLLVDVRSEGEGHVIDEINEHYAPELTTQFIRITRRDGGVLYQSAPPKDGSFVPARVPAVKVGFRSEFSREVEGAGSVPLLIEALPFETPDGDWYLIETGTSLRPMKSALGGLLLILALGMPVVVVGAIVGVYLLMRKSLRPVDEITRQAERIRLRNLGDRLQVQRTGDELERLATALNRMLARLEDSFHNINRFSADASHELRTPLTILRGELEALARQPDLPVAWLEPIGSMLEETGRLGRIIDHLLTISRLDAGAVQMEGQVLDLGALARSTAEQMRLLAEEKRISVKYSVSPSVMVFGDPARLVQMIVNLLDNAIKYTGEEGHVELSTSTAGDAAILEVSDDGHGISAEALPHVFERFYRADKARSRESGGTGLGLSIVKAICSAHNGSIAISSVEGEGTRVRVEMPLHKGFDRPSEGPWAPAEREQV
jgi:heavy metal sensor kinase